MLVTCRVGERDNPERVLLNVVKTDYKRMALSKPVLVTFKQSPLSEDSRSIDILEEIA